MRGFGKDIPASMGVNLFEDRRIISDAEVVRTENLVPYQPGTLKKRPTLGFVQPATTGLPLLLLFPPFDALAQYIAVTRTTGFPLSDGTAATPVVTKTVAIAADGSALHTGSFDIPTKYRPAYFYFQSRIYFFPGYPSTVQGQIIQAIGPSPGSEVVAFHFDDETLKPPAVATIYSSRAAYADFGPGFESYLVMSDDNDPTTVMGPGAIPLLSADSRALTIGPGDGDRIVALAELLQVGGAIMTQRSLLILKEYSAYIMNGELNQTTDVEPPVAGANVTVARIPYECGCASPNTLTRTPFGLIWASFDDVWIFPDGAMPHRIGSKIRPQLLTNTPALRYLWDGAYVNGFYRLSIFGAGQVTNDDSAKGEQWWLDLREGVPNTWREAKWYGPQIYTIYSPTALTTVGTRTFGQDARPGKDHLLFGLEYAEDNTFTGPNAIVQYDVNSGRDISTNASLYKQLGSEVSTLLVSKEYTAVSEKRGADDPMVDKIHENVELSLCPTFPMQVRVDAVADGGKTVDSGYRSLSQAGFALGADVTDPLLVVPGGPTANPVVPTSAVLPKWTFDEPTGLVAGGNLVFTGGTPGIVGKVNLARDVNSNTGTLNTTTLGPTDLLFKGWVYFPSARGRGGTLLISQGGSDNFRMVFNADGTITVSWAIYTFNGTTYVHAAGTSTCTTQGTIGVDAWHLVEFSRTQTSFKPAADPSPPSASFGPVMAINYSIDGVFGGWALDSDAAFMTYHRAVDFPFGACGITLTAFKGYADEWELLAPVGGGGHILPNPTIDGSADFGSYAANTNLSRDFITLAVYPDPTQRLIGKSLQYQISDLPGYVIDDTCDTISFVVHDTVLGNVTFSASVPQGWYANLYNLLLTLCPAMQAASGAYIQTTMQPDSTRPEFVVILNRDGRTWQPLFGSGGSVVTKLGAILGFGAVDPALATTQTATEAVYSQQSADFEIGGINFFANVIPRRPQ